MPVLLPTTVAEALEHLEAHPGATFLAGGTDLMVEVNFGHRSPGDVIALRCVDELRSWRRDGDTVHLGSGVPWRVMETGELARLLPALAEAARTVGSPQIRAAGTLGGNLGTCSPAGDGLPVLSALDAVVHLRGRDTARDVPVHDFMVGVKRNDRRPDEIITGVSLPVLEGWQGYAKVGQRNAMVIAIASACLAHDPAGGSVRLALGAVGPTVVRCRDAERWLAGEHPLTSRTSIPAEISREFGRRAALEARPIDDHRSTAEYRRHAIGVLADRLLRRAFP